MQKIIINNFGVIKYAEIEVKKILVLIGEQASGKSTIAKLIYFFKSLKDDLFTQIYQDTNYSYFEPISDIINPIIKKFESFFGSTKNLPDFKIVFYYSVEKNKFLILSIDENKRLKPQVNKLLDSNFRASTSSLKRHDDNQLIITTHSPYVLTVFNNLLFANRVVEKKSVNTIRSSTNNSPRFLVKC